MLPSTRLILRVSQLTPTGHSSALHVAGLSELFLGWRDSQYTGSQRSRFDDCSGDTLPSQSIAAFVGAIWTYDLHVSARYNSEIYLTSHNRILHLRALDPGDIYTSPRFALYSKAHLREARVHKRQHAPSRNIFPSARLDLTIYLEVELATTSRNDSSASEE